MDKDKIKVAILIAVGVIAGYILGMLTSMFDYSHEINELRESNEFKREIIVTYGSYERACDEIFTTDSPAAWDSLHVAQHRLDSLFSSEL